MTKIYYDKEKKLEVQDLSGVKSLVDINFEFNGNFEDITAKREEEAKNAPKPPEPVVDEAEVLIQAKIRELAIEALKVEGKLDELGAIPEIELPKEKSLE